MTNENVSKLSSRLVKYYKSELDEDTRRLIIHIIRAIAAKGEPVEAAQLAQLMDQPTEKVTQLLADITVRDEQGRVVGFGLSLIPTDHQFEVNGHTLWTWCAVDSLLFPPLLNLPARIKSHCPVTGEMIKIALTPETIEKVTPASAVVSIVTPKLDKIADVRQLVCSNQSFFKSAGVAKEWQKKHPDALILSVTDTFTLYKQITKQVWTVEA